MADTSVTISGIHAIVAEAMEHYETVKGDHTLGITFHEAGRGLGLIRDALRLLQTQQHTAAVEVPPSTDTAQAQSSPDTLLKDCHNDATVSRNLFHQISQVSLATRVQSYRDLLTANGNQRLVENLILNLMQNIYCLAKYYGTAEWSLKELWDEIYELKRMKSLDPIKRNEGNHSYLNSASGTQFNATTFSTQYNSTGSGTNFAGANFHGAVIFSKI